MTDALPLFLRALSWWYFYHQENMDTLTARDGSGNNKQHIALCQPGRPHKPVFALSINRLHPGFLLSPDAVLYHRRG